MRFGCSRIVLIIITLACSSCSLLDLTTPKPEQPHRAPVTRASKGTERLVIYSEGWHTGIVIPASSLTRHPWTRNLKMNGAHYADFGWGEDEFYRRDDVTLGMIIRALFWPTISVIHLDRVTGSPYEYYHDSQVITLELTRPQVDALIHELSKSFSTNPDGSLIDLGKGLKKNSTFYRSRLKYYYPETCNIWTARLLNAAGVQVKGVTRSPELMKRIERSSKVVR